MACLTFLISCHYPSFQLFQILDLENVSSIVSRLPHGKGFMIHDKQRFDSEVLQVYFQGVKFTSFVRRMKRWGFSEKRISRLNTPDPNNHEHKSCHKKYAYHVFYHPQFIRGDIEKCLEMKNPNANNGPQIVDARITRNEQLMKRRPDTLEANLNDYESREYNSIEPFQRQQLEDYPVQHSIAGPANVRQFSFPLSTTTLTRSNLSNSFMTGHNNTHLLRIRPSDLASRIGSGSLPPRREFINPANDVYSRSTTGSILPHYHTPSSEEQQQARSQSAFIYYKARYEMNVQRQADLAKQEIELSRLALMNDMLMSSMDAPSSDDDLETMTRQIMRDVDNGNNL